MSCIIIVNYPEGPMAFGPFNSTAEAHAAIPLCTPPNECPVYVVPLLQSAQKV